MTLILGWIMEVLAVLVAMVPVLLYFGIVLALLAWIIKKIINVFRR